VARGCGIGMRCQSGPFGADVIGGERIPPSTLGYVSGPGGIHGREYAEFVQFTALLDGKIFELVQFNQLVTSGDNVVSV
jgi:hypothetical protein